MTVAIPTNPSLGGDVIARFKELMNISVGDSSLYITAIDDIETIANNEVLSISERSKLISKIASDMVGSVTISSMQNAFELAKTNRDAQYEYPLLEATICYNKAVAANTEEEEKVLQAEVDKNKHLVFKARVKALEEMGMSGWVPNSTSFSELGKADYGLKMLKNKAAESKTYAMYAKSLRENGWVSIDNSQWMNVDNSEFTLQNYQIAMRGINYNQSRVQHRNYFAYEDNRQQHLINSISSLTGGFFTEDNADILTEDLLVYWDKVRIELTKPSI